MIFIISLALDLRSAAAVTQLKGMITTLKSLDQFWCLFLKFAVNTLIALISVI